MDVWLRPDLDLTAFLRAPSDAVRRLDTALFDVDGVLVETGRSYLLAVMRAAECLVREARGLRAAPAPMVAPEDVALFKLAGGFNSDWDCTRLFAALWTARLREWRGRPEADVSMAEWAARATEAALAGRGGLAWLRSTVPASAIPSAEEARWAHDEFYWGAALAQELFGHEPRYAPDAPGFVANEELLLDAALLHDLAARGIARFGLITGREGPEVTWAIRQIAALYEAGTRGDEALARGVTKSEDSSDAPPGDGRGLAWHDGEHGRTPFGAIVPANEAAKPDPRALVLALGRLHSRAALYVGDTADDLELVLRYRREVRAANPDAPPVLAVSVAEGQAAEAFRARGADVVLARVTELPAALDALG